VPAPDPRPCPRNTHNADVHDFICEEEHHKRKSAYMHRSFSVVFDTPGFFARFCTLPLKFPLHHFNIKTTTTT
jgi:hypothetical protein